MKKKMMKQTISNLMTFNNIEIINRSMEKSYSVNVL